MHKAAKGQDFGQSGTAGFCFGQQGIPSDTDAMSSIAAAGAAAIDTDGAATGVMSKLTTARIESRRGKRARSLTSQMSHMLQCRKRGARSHCRQRAATHIEHVKVSDQCPGMLGIIGSFKR
jgi:hypothetical protein